VVFRPDFVILCYNKFKLNIELDKRYKIFMTGYFRRLVYANNSFRLWKSRGQACPGYV
jgi:hypothetical protein